MKAETKKEPTPRYHVQMRDFGHVFYDKESGRALNLDKVVELLNRTSQCVKCGKKIVNWDEHIMTCESSPAVKKIAELNARIEDLEDVIKLLHAGADGCDGCVNLKSEWRKLPDEEFSSKRLGHTTFKVLLSTGETRRAMWYFIKSQALLMITPDETNTTSFAMVPNDITIVAWRHLD
jgi:hypothetical protein